VAPLFFSTDAGIVAEPRTPPLPLWLDLEAPSRLVFLSLSPVLVPLPPPLQGEEASAGPLPPENLARGGVSTRTTDGGAREVSKTYRVLPSLFLPWLFSGHAQRR
jgi:hypothetical protein